MPWKKQTKGKSATAAAFMDGSLAGPIMHALYTQLHVSLKNLWNMTVKDRNGLKSSIFLSFSQILTLRTCLSLTNKQVFFFFFLANSDRNTCLRISVIYILWCLNLNFVAVLVDKRRADRPLNSLSIVPLASGLSGFFWHYHSNEWSGSDSSELRRRH